MKKLILLFLLFYSFAYSQVDTANWSFLPNQTNGKFTALISRELYYGISGGQYKQMSLSATSYDSTVFQLIPNQLNGRYTIIQNIVPYYGKDSGTVQMQLFNDPTLTSKYVQYSDSLTKYSTPASVNNLIGDTSYIGHLNQPENITGDWSYKTFKTTPVAITNDTLFATTGSVFTKTLAANTIFKLSGISDGQLVTLAVTNTVSNYTVAWSALGGLTLLWSGGTAPTQTTGAKTDIYSFQRIGNNIYGAAIQNF